MIIKDYMKTTILLVLLLISSIVFSQTENSTLKRYYVKVVDESLAPKFVNENGNSQYVGKDKKEQLFFSKYHINKFEQAYPTSKRQNLRNAFLLFAYSETIAEELLKEFPKKYTVIEDISDLKVELNSTPYEPNDYVTSPVRIPFDTNTYDRPGLAYINAPKAWGITDTINNPISIGISDAKVNDLDADFSDKISFVNYTYGSLGNDCGNIEATHGTGVAAIAAAQGDNNHGTVGVCYDCDIVATDYDYFDPDPNIGWLGRYHNLLLLAQEGVRVINMSWGYKSFSPPDVYIASSVYRSDAQDLVNEVVEDYGVVLVAAAGNLNSFNSSGPHIRYEYPASYDNVISVTGVNHWYTVDNYPDSEPTFEPPNGEKYIRNIEDSVAQLVDISQPEPIGIYSQYWAPDATYMQTVNEHVDICSPGYQILGYAPLSLGCTLDPDPVFGGKYRSGTSSAAPFVTGTIGLMFMVNECLTPNEVEDILKLTSKDIESNPINRNFLGYIGSGKLETGNTIEFVDEMSKTDGNAVIANHIFYRYDFSLQHIMNDLSINNVTFKDDAIADFSAKNSIQLQEGTLLQPNAVGYTQLKVDGTITPVTCTPLPTSRTSTNTEEKSKSNAAFSISVFPNPTENTVTLDIATKNNLNEEVQSLEVFDMSGNLIFTSKSQKIEFPMQLNLTDYATGIYIAKVTTTKSTYSKKVIKR